MASSAGAIQTDFQAFLNKMVSRFEPYSALRKEVQMLQQLSDSFANPFTLAVFGRMKTGKSSLINAMVGRPLTITGVEEATATINWISYGDEKQAKSMLVHWNDGRVEPLSLEDLKNWEGKEDRVLERVNNTAFLQLYATIEKLKTIQVVDTPGTGSVADEHENVAQKFLSPEASENSLEESRKADALMYVFPPVGRQGDKDALGDFSATRMPGSDPYNSIGVLHKWDGLEIEEMPNRDGSKSRDDLLFENAKLKADRLKETLKGMICDVIPVSAPLAMVARHAPDSFLEALLELVNDPSSAELFEKALKRDSRWDKDERRKQVRAMYDLPWVSFKRVIYLLSDHQVDSIEEVRAICLKASNIETLEREMDARFYRRSAMIKQRLARVKATKSIERGLAYFVRRQKELADDIRNYEKLQLFVSDTDPVASWLDSKIKESVKNKEQLDDWAESSDRIWLQEKERMKLLEVDFTILEEMDKDPTLIEDCDASAIRTLLNERVAGDNCIHWSLTVLNVMLRKYQELCMTPNRKKRKYYERITYRLLEEIKKFENQIA